MRKSWKIGLILLFIVLIVEIVLIAPQTLDIKNPLDVTFDKILGEDEILQKMQGVHLVEASEGEKRWELWAETATSFKQDDSWSVSNVKAEFTTKKGLPYKVKGDRGIVLANKDMSIEGNVVIVSENGYKFKTQQVSYSAKNHSLKTQSLVRMLGIKGDTGYNMILTAKGLSGNLKESIVELLANVRGKKNFKNGEEIKLKSHRAQFSGQNFLSKFIGDVIIDADTMRITGDVAGIGLNPKANELQRVIIEGGVKVSDRTKWATAHQVEADFLENKFIFKGNPRVVQDRDELRGDEIIFLNGGKTVKVRKAKIKVTKDKLENGN